MSTASAVSRTGATSPASAAAGGLCWAWQETRTRAAAAAVSARNNQFLPENLLGHGLADGLVHGVDRSFEQPADHWLEKFERGAVIVGIERSLVVQLAESSGILKMLMTPKRLAHVAVHSEIVKEII